jgi:NADP-reducing hydrogenase subunit HndB
MSKRISNADELKALRDKARAAMELREGPKDTRVTVHMGTCGIAAGARDVLTYLMEELGPQAASMVTLSQSGCAGLCGQEPMMTITDAQGRTFRYGNLDRQKVKEIVEGHLRGGQPLKRLLIEG